MHTLGQFHPDGPKCCPHSLLDRLATDNETSGLPRLRAKVRKAEKIERLGFSEPQPFAFFDRVATKADQPGLARVQGQLELAHPFLQILQERSRLSLMLKAHHRNGISARQLWLQLGLGSYKTAWLLLQKLRRAMIASDRSPLSGLVEVDETSMPFRTSDTPINPKPGRSHEGKMMIAGAVEIHEKAPGRLRPKVIDDYSAKTLGTLFESNIVPGSTAISDGWSGYLRLKNVKHEPKVAGPMAVHILLPWIHRVFGNAKRWAMGAYHGLRTPHLQRYLDEFAFRFNRRKTPQAAFASLLSIAAKRDHASYQMLIQQN